MQTNHFWHGKKNVYFLDKNNHLKTQNIAFKRVPGFSRPSMRQSALNLHSAFKKKHLIPMSNPLEISSVSTNPYGKQASAMNMKIKTSHGVYRMEQLFQASKVFRNKYTGKIMSLQSSLNLPPVQAKHRASYANKNGKLIDFKMFGHKFGLEPKTYFYDWTYLHGLEQHPNLANQIAKHYAFTDIWAGKHTINTQAKSCALYSSLRNNYGQRARKIINNPKKFKQIEASLEPNYPGQSKKNKRTIHNNTKRLSPNNNKPKPNAQQLSLFNQPKR